MAPLVPKVLPGPEGHLGVRFSHVKRKSITPKSSGSHIGAVVHPQATLAMCGGLFDVTTQGGGTAGIQRVEPGVLLAVLQGTGRPSAENHAAQSVSDALRTFWNLGNISALSFL